MQYTPHYNLNLPEGTDIVNPLIQDNPNYSAIDAALYANKQRVVGTATHTKTGTNHSIVLADSDIPVFRFVATGDYVTGDTFSVDGVTVTARVSDGSTIPTGAFKINSTIVCALDGTILNLINVDSTKSASSVGYDNTSSGLAATDVQGAIDEIDSDVDVIESAVSDNYHTTIATTSETTLSYDALLITELDATAQNWSYAGLRINNHTIYEYSAGGTTSPTNRLFLSFRVRSGSTISPATSNGGVVRFTIVPIY